VATVHPGFIPTTELSRNLQNPVAVFFMKHVLPLTPITLSVEDGARRLYKSATDVESNGRYIGNGSSYQQESATARDQPLAKELWNKSCELLGRQDWIS